MDHLEMPGLSAPSPNWMRVSTFANVLETADNHDREHATVSESPPPVALNGIISKKGEMDWFRFKAKKSEPLEIICFAVNLTPLEIEWRINQVGRRFECIALPDAHEWTFPAPFNFQIIYECAVKKGPIDLIVERRDEKRICARCVQGLGQRTGNIGQAAGLGKGNCFG